MSPAQFQMIWERILSVECRYLKLCHTREELGRLPQGPKLVLATLPSLQAGMARDLFVEWAADPRNLILFTQAAEVRPNHLVLMFCSWLLLIPAMAVHSALYIPNQVRQSQLLRNPCTVSFAASGLC